MIHFNPTAVITYLLLWETPLAASFLQSAGSERRLSPSSRRMRTTARWASSPTIAEPEARVESKEIEKVDAVVCGGGPAGLLTAIMLSQKLPTSSQGSKIRVYDRLSEPPNPDDDTVWNDVAKFYLIGLGGRGQAALDEFGVWKGVVENRCVAVVGRKDWQPDAVEGVERIFDKSEKRVPTQVLPRDKLVGCLHQHILERYGDRIELHYGYEVHPLELDNPDGVLLELAKCDNQEIARMNPSSVKTASEAPQDVMCNTENTKLVSAGLLVAADGTVRTIANAIEAADRSRIESISNPINRLWNMRRPFRVKRYADDNQRIYKTVPMNIPSTWRPDLNYSARSSKDATFDALPANREGKYCGVLLLKKDNVLAKENTDPKELRDLFDESFPYFSDLIDDATMEQVARKPVSFLPGFRYAGPDLHFGDRCVILGDCAHTVKPYFGLGANSALEDVRILGNALDESKGDISQSIRSFSKQRAADSRAMVRMSRDLDRPGMLGFVTFILPLILDSIFSKHAPRVFTPNVINMMQREMYSFRRVARRKRLDRFLQLSVLLSGFSSAALVARFLLRKVSQTCGIPSRVILAGVAGTGFVVQLAKRILPTRTTADDDNSLRNVRTAAEVLAKFDKKSGVEKTEI